ncbi:MAG TPA: ABC transporter ATP-binding protein [Oligoflexia bacterium]|nr:ABC transporter ATP-binding protein [Oligoflexia bacterium]HMP47207.1 ABC transporter ATP-binding protein [Oligoflexia bacterium]
MIEVSGLSRSFDEIQAVCDLSFKVKKGELLGFLGPNGAGKSTTMKMLTCFLTPSSGTAKIGGFDIIEQPEEVRSIVGYLPENAPLYGEMRVCDFLSFVARVRSLNGSKEKSAIDRVIDSTSLEEVLDRRIETLSKGFKRRVGLAQAIIHDPSVLILDEPTDGLDPNQKHEVRKLIKSMARDKCIVLSTHILEEVDAVCTRAIIIAHGRLLADGTPAQLRRKVDTRDLFVLQVPEGIATQAQEKLASQSFIRELRLSETVPGKNDLLELVPEGRSPEALQKTLNMLSDLQIPVMDLHLRGGQLDEVFRNITMSPLS